MDFSSTQHPPKTSESHFVMKSLVAVELNSIYATIRRKKMSNEEDDEEK